MWKWNKVNGMWNMKWKIEYGIIPMEYKTVEAEGVSGVGSGVYHSPANA